MAAKSSDGRLGLWSLQPQQGEPGGLPLQLLSMRIPGSHPWAGGAPTGRGGAPSAANRCRFSITHDGAYLCVGKHRNNGLLGALAGKLLARKSTFNLHNAIMCVALAPLRLAPQLFMSTPSKTGALGIGKRCVPSSSALLLPWAGNSAGDVYLYDTATGGRAARVAAAHKLSGPVRAAALSEDGRHLLAARGNGYILRYGMHLWSAIDSHERVEVGLHRRCTARNCDHVRQPRLKRGLGRGRMGTHARQAAPAAMHRGTGLLLHARAGFKFVGLVTNSTWGCCYCTKATTPTHRQLLRCYSCCVLHCNGCRYEYIRKRQEQQQQKAGEAAGAAAAAAAVGHGGAGAETEARASGRRSPSASPGVTPEPCSSLPAAGQEVADEDEEEGGKADGSGAGGAGHKRQMDGEAGEQGGATGAKRVRMEVDAGAA